MNMSKFYESERANPVNLSFWFPKVKDCGIAVPETQIYIMPETLFTNMMLTFYEEPPQDGPKFEDALRSWLDSEVMPNLHPFTPYFIKNGAFSNKFDFSTCVTTKDELQKKFTTISYDAVCLETSGHTELIVRELIPHNDQEVAHIYKGMPLRTEVRVFYDFDNRKVMYSANYWDYDYCRPHIRSKTDQIIFDHERDKIATDFAAKRDETERIVAEAMKDVDMTGPWSIDVMYAEDYSGESTPYLIDMAPGPRSAYWHNTEK